MEVFLLIILIALIVLIFTRINAIKVSVEDRTDNLRKDIQQLRNELKTFQSQAPVVVSPIAVAPVETPEIADTPSIPVEPVKPGQAEESKPSPEPYIYDRNITITPERQLISTDPADLTPEETMENEEEMEVLERKIALMGSTPPPPVRVRQEPELSFWEKFLKNNPDMEKFIGENLINKIGIAILVLGIGYFVKFAIDQDWINEIGRVCIGILAGGILIGVAHRLRWSFSAFSSVLVGGGLSVLYFTIAIAFHEYQIFSQTVAFILMVVITAFSIVLSISYNRIELAVLSLVGGFATPFMVSTGEGNYQVLFTYVLILNLGMLTLSYFKKWNLVHVIAYGFTVLLYGGWLSTRVLDMPNAPYVGAMVFGTLYYLIFMGMNIIYNIREKAKFSPLEITLLLSNTSFYYAAGMLILAHVNQGAYQGLFTVAVAVFNFLFAFFLYKRETVDRNLIFLLIGLVITFVSLAVPVQLEGNYITMFWALEAVLLLWLSQKSGLTLVAKGSIVVTGLMLISLCMDWNNVYGLSAATHPLPILLNKAFITSFLSVASLVITLLLLRNQREAFNLWIGKLEVAPYRQLLSFVAGAVIYLAFALELNYQLISYVGYSPSRTILMGSYNLLFMLGLLLFAQRQGLDKLVLQTGATMLAAFGIFLYIVYFNPATMELLKEHFLQGEATFIGFPFHYVSMALVIGLLVLLARNKTLFTLISPLINKAWPWFMGVVVVWIASSELFFHVIYFKFSYADTVGLVQGSEKGIALYERFSYLISQANKVGLPILWGICAFVFMWIGLRQKNRILRILSLSLFALTLVKLFLYDIQGISEGGKIAAFISLGVLLLTISFMYQKIRKLILADDLATPVPEADREIE
jgi:uncharacterized membrane protein